MRIAKTLFVVLGLVLLVGVLVTPARADQWNKETVLTFNQPVEIPGKLLPAGTYVFISFCMLTQLITIRMTLGLGMDCEDWITSRLEVG